MNSTHFPWPTNKRYKRWAKVMFLQASVILLTGGGVPQCMLGYPHPPQADTPRSRHPPPRNRHPPPGIRLTSGRYASYWNAYLFLLLLYKFHALPVTYQQTLRVPYGSFTRIFFFDLCHCSLWTSNWTSYEREGTLTPILRWWSRTENHNFSTNHW